jgi:hypothetical protein
VVLIGPFLDGSCPPMVLADFGDSLADVAGQDYIGQLCQRLS